MGSVLSFSEILVFHSSSYKTFISYQIVCCFGGDHSLANWFLMEVLSDNLPGDVCCDRQVLWQTSDVCCDRQVLCAVTDKCCMLWQTSDVCCDRQMMCIMTDKQCVLGQTSDVHCTRQVMCVVTEVPTGRREDGWHRDDKQPSSQAVLPPHGDRAEWRRSGGRSSRASQMDDVSDCVWLREWGFGWVDEVCGGAWVRGWAFFGWMAGFWGWVGRLNGFRVQVNKLMGGWLNCGWLVGWGNGFWVGEWLFQVWFGRASGFWLSGFRVWVHELVMCVCELVRYVSCGWIGSLSVKNRMNEFNEWTSKWMSLYRLLFVEFLQLGTVSLIPNLWLLIGNPDTWTLTKFTHTHKPSNTNTHRQNEKHRYPAESFEEGENTLSNCKTGVSLPSGLMKSVEPCLGFANRFVWAANNVAERQVLVDAGVVRHVRTPPTSCTGEPLTVKLWALLSAGTIAGKSGQCLFGSGRKTPAYCISEGQRWQTVGGTWFWHLGKGVTPSTDSTMSTCRRWRTESVVRQWPHLPSCFLHLHYSLLEFYFVNTGRKVSE